MTLSEQSPPRRAGPHDLEDSDVAGHSFGWYDPDAAAFDRPDARLPTEPMTDDDEAGVIDRD